MGNFLGGDSSDISKYIELMNRRFEMQISYLNRRNFFRTSALAASGLFGVACKVRSDSELKDATGGAVSPLPWSYPGASFLQDYNDLINSMKARALEILVGKHMAANPGDDPAVKLNEFSAIIPQYYQSLNPKEFGWASGVLDSTLDNLPDQKKDEIKVFYKTLATIRGKLVAKLISSWLSAPDPTGVEVNRAYEMFAQLRESTAQGLVFDGTFQPFIGPVIITKRKNVLSALLDHENLTVDLYATEMNKTMRGDPDQVHFILGTDEPNRYIPDAKILKGTFSKEGFDEQTAGAVRRADSDIVRAICKKSADNWASKNGNKYNVKQLGSHVAIDVIREYFGVEIVPVKSRQKRATRKIDYSSLAVGKELASQYWNITGDELAETQKPTGFSNPTTGLQEITVDGKIVNWKLTDDAPASVRKDHFTLPTYDQMYTHLRNGFHNFFNNVQQDEQVSLRSLKSTFELMSLIAYNIEMEQNRLAAGGEERDNTLLQRLVNMQKKAQDPEQKRALSNLRIRENLFGIIIGAIINQEEQTIRAIDFLASMSQTNHRFNAQYGDFIASLNDNDKMLQYYNEALRFQPQGEILLRVCKSDTAHGGPIKARQTVFVSQGSAMRDIDDADKFLVNRPRESYIQHGYGRHRCLGQYFSNVITIETIKRVFKNASPEAPVKKSKLEMDEINLYPVRYSIEVTQGY
jgi:cytochrome P450